MNDYENKLRHAKLEALRQERVRQDEALADAGQALVARFGTAPVVVSVARLQAVDEACLARVSPLTTSSALRG